MIEKVMSQKSRPETFSEILNAFEFKPAFKKPQAVEDFWSQCITDSSL
jgi:hypothetical protein